MYTGITVTRRYVPRSQQTNKAGSKIDADAFITMETSSAFLRSWGFAKGLFFLKDGLVKYDVGAR